MRNRMVAANVTKNIPMTALIILFVGLVIHWAWPRSPVELSRDGYAITTALYRVCNQQDRNGLKEIDEHLQQATRSRKLPDDQRDVILVIIRDAQSGNWNGAMKQCRDLLEDHVTQDSRRAETSSLDRQSWM